jgi:hypothetical protein
MRVICKRQVTYPTLVRRVPGRQRHKNPAKGGKAHRGPVKSEVWVTSPASCNHQGHTSKRFHSDHGLLYTHDAWWWLSSVCVCAFDAQRGSCMARWHTVSSSP